MVAFEQRGNLGVLRCDLGFEKDILAFELRQVAVVGRDRTRLVGAGRRVLRRQLLAFLPSDICRGWSRHVASCRCRQFGNLGDVTRDRLRRNHILITERRFLSQAVEVALGTITLDCSDGAGVAGMLISNSGLVDSEGVLVGAGRGMSRRVGGHSLDDSAAYRVPSELSPQRPLWRIDGRSFGSGGRTLL